MVRSTAEDQDNRKDKKTNDGQNFDRGQPEFDFTEESDPQVIEKNDSNKEDGYEDSRIDLLPWYPILNDKRGGSQLIRCDDDVYASQHVPSSRRILWAKLTLEPVRVAKREAQRRVAETGRISREAGLNG